MANNRTTIWEFFIKNYKFTLLLAVTILLFGVLAVIQMPKESQPEVDIPIGVVVTAFPGASVEDVEEVVTDTIEDKLASLNDVKQITSVSRRGLSSITIEFDADADTDKKIEDLKDIIDNAKRELPDQAEDPIVQKVSLDDTPFLTLAIGGPLNTAELKQYADVLKDEIEQVPGVSTVQLFGGLDRELQVLVKKDVLDTFGLSLTQVTQAIQQANSDIPVGTIITNNEEFNIRFSGNVRTKEDVENIPITTHGGIPIFVRDVAEVRDTFAEQNKIIQLANAPVSSESAVILRVFKSSGGDVTKIADTILERTDEIKGEFPEEVFILETENLAQLVKDDLSNLGTNGVATVIIVALLLALFLGWRESFMAAISIPLSFLMTFIILFYMGNTINFMSLFSLILSLGILVDSTIVVNESLNKQVQEKSSFLEAAHATIHELQYPLIAGTLTTVFAFVPMLLTGGILGEFIKSIPITVTAVLLSSLFVALAVIPSLTYFLHRRQKRKEAKKQMVKEKKPARFSHVFDRLREKYAHSLQTYIDRKSKRRWMAAGLALAFIMAFSLPVIGMLPIELFPPDDQDTFGIDLELPFGTPVVETQQTLVKLESYLYDDDRIESYTVNAGYSGGLGSAAGGGEGSHLGNIVVNLKEDREQKSFEIIDEYQEKLKHFSPGEVRVSQPSYGPGAAAPVEVTIQGEDFATLATLARDFEDILANIDGTKNIQSSLATTNGQFVFKINRVAAAQYGLSTNNIALTLRNAISGLTATEVQQNGEDIDVTVRYLLSDGVKDIQSLRATDIETIKSLTLATPQGDIPLSAVVDIELESGKQQIQHEDKHRVVKVTSDLQSDVTPQAVFKEINTVIEGMDIPDGYIISLGGQDEDTQQSLQDMARAMILAVILIAGLLVLQFKSFRQAIIVLITIPLALIGVFPGLFMVGLPLSFPGMIGVVALAGIVVNNAIILIDKINTYRTEGYDVQRALVAAGKSRLEPILLTTITTVFGILPLALTQPIWSSLGFAIVFGLIFSTISTLYVVPIMYNWWCKHVE